jgi:hypothetical protein
MNPKTSTVRLYVALISLVAALLEFVTAIVRLVTTLLLRAAAFVRPRPTAQPPLRPNLRVVPPLANHPDQGVRLTAALVGMGWPVPAVRRFVDGLGDRVGREPIEALIKEGLASLAA